VAKCLPLLNWIVSEQAVERAVEDRDDLVEVGMAAVVLAKALRPAVAQAVTMIEVVTTTVVVTMADVRAVTMIAAVLAVAIMEGSVVQ
jgi:hypothetical protein